jgi:hypothetical protein
MITDYFKPTTNKGQSIITEYYELHRNFYKRNQLKTIYSEVQSHLQNNSSRKSCVCIDSHLHEQFHLYNLPLIPWTTTCNDIRNQILNQYSNSYSIDYGLIHYYHDFHSNIGWHSDREALRSNIYSISIGGTRIFCLRDQQTNDVMKFHLMDGDLFIMKTGCQDKYKHCILSKKEYNNSRISITFRQLEIPILFYTYYPLEKRIQLSEKEPNDGRYKKISETREKIMIGIINHNDIDDFKINKKELSLSLIKSNLQKAIRRKKEDVALHSTMELIQSGYALDLLRRLTIISIEDVLINTSYCIIVWYFIALSNHYVLSNEDVDFIYSYVKYICHIEFICENEDDHPSHYHHYGLHNIIQNVDCIALYLRLQYGGFNGEKTLLNKHIHDIMMNQIMIYDNDLIIEKHRKYNTELPILKCSIDFHCFTNMIENVYSKILMEDSNTIITQTDVKNYIWHFDSNVNARIVPKKNGLDESLWKTVMKPKCDMYRFAIMKLLNLKKLYE